MDVSTGGGTVKIDLVTPPSFPYTNSYENGTAVALEAVPSFGYAFDSWSGDLSCADNPVFLIIDCEKNIAASFTVDLRLVGTFIGSLVLVVFFVAILIIRRKAPANTSLDIRD